MNVLSEEEKSDLKAYLVFKANEAGQDIGEDDPELLGTIDQLDCKMGGSAVLTELLEKSILHKESLE